MNSSGRVLTKGDVVRLVVMSLLSLWVMVVSVPATLSSQSTGGNQMGLAVLPAAPEPAQKAPAQAVASATQAGSLPAAATFTPMPTVAVATFTPLPTSTTVSSSTPVPSNTPIPTSTPIPPTSTTVPTSTPVPTKTPVPPTSTPRPPTATPIPPTPTPVPPPPIRWDGDLSFLGVGIAGAPVAPGQQYWRVVQGIFQDWNEGSQGHAIGVEILDEGGNRLGLGFGTEVGVAANGGQVPLAWTKLDQPYPVIYDIYGGLGSYAVWITLGGLPSERVSGMGLVSTNPGGTLVATPGRMHCNYLITFQRATK